MSAPRRGTTAVVLVLHGGKSVSREVSASTHLSPLRMLPFAWGVRRRTRRQGVAVCRLRYRYRGWNGAEASPVTDARWALEEVRRRFGDVPVVLLGHSMGGRTAVHVADDASVRGLVLLAPWVTAADPVRLRPGVPVTLLHGDHDVITSARSSLAWGERAQRAGAVLTAEILRDGEHFMLRRYRLWQRLAVDAVVAQLAAARAPGPKESVSPEPEPGEPRWLPTSALTSGERRR